jgi:PST family polysaccharide transporter
MRNVLLLWFASAGWGARSFLLPQLITNCSDSLLLWVLTRYSPWTMHPRFDRWRELFAGGRWVLLGTFAIALGNNGAYFLLGRVLPSDSVGSYFFAYQLVVQLGVLLSDNIYQVLVPTFALMSADRPRMRAAVPRALGTVALIGAAASLLIATLYEPLERMLWHGKWASAAPCVRILAVVWPAAAAMSVLRALQMSSGLFKQWGIVTLFSAVASVTGTVVGAAMGHSAAAAAIGFGIGSLLSAALNGTLALSRVGVSPLKAAAAVLRPWLFLLAAAVIAHYAARLVAGPGQRLAVAAVTFGALGLASVMLFDRDGLRMILQALERLSLGRSKSRAALSR